MFPRIRQQAWISGLPGLVKEGGIPLETLPISAPKPEARSLIVTIYCSSEMVSNLQSLSKQRITLPALSFVVRTDATKKLDNQYLMAGAVIDSVLPMKDLVGATAVNIFFNSITMKMGVSMNPGPPVNSPPVQPTGVNMGWIYGLPDEAVKSGKAIEVVDFTSPHHNRRLTVTLGKPSNEIQNLINHPISTRELILVLPDHTTQRYVEFKLWDAKAILLEDEQHVAFESDMIECLTGQET